MAYSRKPTGAGCVIALLAMSAVMIVGWILNVIHICRLFDDPITPKFIFMCIGVFVAPLGSLLGFIL